VLCSVLVLQMFLAPPRGSSAAGAGPSWVGGTRGMPSGEILGGNGPAAGALIGLTACDWRLASSKETRGFFGFLCAALFSDFAFCSSLLLCLLSALCSQLIWAYSYSLLSAAGPWRLGLGASLCAPLALPAGTAGGRREAVPPVVVIDRHFGDLAPPGNRHGARV
jgi:hypothetical protein